MATSAGTGSVAEPFDPADTANLWRRGTTYYCRVEVGGRSERVSLRTGDLRTAQRARDQILREAEERRAGLVPPEPVATWEDAVVAYAAAVLDRPGALSPETAQRYRVSLRVISPFLRGMRIDAINGKAIGRLVTSRQAQGVTNATIRRDLTAVSRVLGLATANGLREGGNPAKDYDRSYLSEDREAIRPPTDAEVDRAAKLIEDAHPQWPLLIRWLRATGMRLSETLSTSRANLEIATEHRRRVYRLTVYKVKGKRRGRMRTITLGADAVALLPKLGLGRLFDHFHPDRRNNVSTQWLKFQESREGMPIFRLHDLRHAYAVAELRRDPTCIYPLKGHLGHSSVSTTERHYLRYLSEEQQHAARSGAAKATPSQGPSQRENRTVRKPRLKAPLDADKT